jgi:hypothetical protein
MLRRVIVGTSCLHWSPLGPDDLDGAAACRASPFKFEDSRRPVHIANYKLAISDEIGCRSTQLPGVEALPLCMSIDESSCR